MYSLKWKKETNVGDKDDQQTANNQTKTTGGTRATASAKINVGQPTSEPGHFQLYFH